MVKSSLLLLVISWMKVVTLVKGSGLPGRHVQVHLHMIFGIQGIRRRGDGKDCAPLPLKERGVRWACLAIFFLALGLGDLLHWGRLEPAFGGNRRSGCRLDSPAEGTGALAPVRFNSLHDCWRAWTDTHVIHSVRTTTTTTSVAILAQVATSVQTVLCCTLSDNGDSRC